MSPISISSRKTTALMCSLTLSRRTITQCGFTNPFVSPRRAPGPSNATNALKPLASPCYSLPMPVKPESQERSGGEILLDRLAAQLSHHALWDTLLLIVPPFGAALYVLAMLFHGAGMNSWAIGIIAIVAIAGTMIATIFRYHRSAPSIPEVAQ